MCRTGGTARGWAPPVLACVLAGACGARSLESGFDGGGPGSISAANDAQGGTPAGGGVPGVVGGSGAAPGSSGTPRTVCPPGDEVASTGGAVLTPPPSVPTRTPFSCAPLPEAFIFPPPASNVPGLYSRCASFSVGQATAVAMSPDGRLAALATGDGIVRVVEVASRQVVAVLPSPRAMIDDVAFAPDGRAILTLARAQREVTLWRSADWTPAAPVWTTILPGHRYDSMFGGGLAFAPDARSAVVSPGTGVFVLDAATGAVRASRQPGRRHPGRRVRSRTAAASSSRWLPWPRIAITTRTAGPWRCSTPTCNWWRRSPISAATPARAASRRSARRRPRISCWSRAGAGDPPACTRSGSATAAAAPAPGLDTLPLAFTPDGKSMLVDAGDVLQRVRADDVSLESFVTIGGASGPVAVSADGSVVAFGGSGDELLRIWRTGEGAVTPVCAAERPAIPGLSSLSADGQLLAIPLLDSIRVLRRSDGVPVMWLPISAAAIHAGRPVAARKLPRDRAGRGRDRGGGRRPVAQRRTRRRLRARLVGVAGLPVHAQRGQGVFGSASASADYSVDAVTFASPRKVTSRIVPPSRPCSASPTVARSCTPRRAARGARAAAATTRRSPAASPIRACSVATTRCCRATGCSSPSRGQTGGRASPCGACGPTRRRC